MCKDKIPHKIDGGFYRYKSRGLIGHKREWKGRKGERRGIKGSGREKRDECFCSPPRLEGGDHKQRIFFYHFDDPLLSRTNVLIMEKVMSWLSGNDSRTFSYRKWLMLYSRSLMRFFRGVSWRW